MIYKIIKTTTIIALFLLVIIISLILYINILKPAYFSVVISCSENPEQILEDYNLFIGGETTYYNKTNITIVLYYDDPSIEKHENCHLIQFQRNFPSQSCEHKVSKYLAEVECYTVENFPNIIYDKLYR